MKIQSYICVLCMLLGIAFLSCEEDNPVNFPVSSGNPPPVNPHLADSHWPISHANSYAQASVDISGPRGQKEDFKKGYYNGGPTMITMAISNEYPDGSRVIWGSDYTRINKIKDTGNGFELIDRIDKENIVLSEVLTISSISGAYNFIDDQNEFYVPGKTTIYVYGDEETGNPSSPIVQLRSFTIPENQLSEEEEYIVGMNLLYDGYVVIATKNGLIMVTDRYFSEQFYIELEDEEISNSIACDEDGGIYVVTSKFMHRIQWTGTELTDDESKGAWIAEYETGEAATGVRLGDGSGSTPTLMGTGEEDKFVVVTDGQDLMHIVLFWRDQIPENWQQIEGTKSRRVAAQIPVTFGNDNVNVSLSEQSVCISGYGALVVNNLIEVSTGTQAGDVLISGDPSIAPYGAEKFVWNSGTKKLSSAWVNTTVSIPNGIPCMSTVSNMAYGVGQNSGYWNFTGLNWRTGQVEFVKPLGIQGKYNSVYAATEIGINGGLYSGTTLGGMGIWER